MTGGDDDPWVVALIRHPRRAEFNVTNQGAEFYLPRARVRARRGKGYVEEPLFPGYAFVRHPDGFWTFLRSTFGVSGVIMAGETRPAKLPNEDIVRLREREGGDGLVRLTQRSYRAGERVRVEKGVFAFDAIVEGMSGEDRVFVLMSILGQWSRTEVSVRDIRE